MLSLLIVWFAISLAAISFLLARAASAFALGFRGRPLALALLPEDARGAPLLARLAFTASGPFAWYLVAVACFAVSLRVGGETRFDTASLRVTPAPGSPAEAGGVREGDRVVSVDDAPVADWDAVRARVAAHRNAEVRLVVERAGEPVELRPVVGGSGRIGISPVGAHREVGVGEAVGEGLKRPFEVVAGAARAFFPAKGAVEVMGPVGIVRAVEKTAHGVAPVATALGVGGGVLSYFGWVPVLGVGLAFPRRRGAGRG